MMIGNCMDLFLFDEVSKLTLILGVHRHLHVAVIMVYFKVGVPCIRNHVYINVTDVHVQHV